jgi:hypothetical protein
MPPSDPPLSPSSRYPSQSAFPDRTSTYNTHSHPQQYPHPNSNRLSVASSSTDHSHVERGRDSSRPSARPPSGEAAPVRHHSLGPSPSHRLSYPSSSPFALQRARSDPPHDTRRMSRDGDPEECDQTSNTFGVSYLQPRISRSMSPDALEGLELVASNFEAATATLFLRTKSPRGALPLRRCSG